MNSIYLDHNSTTPIDPAVAKAIQDCYSAGYVNPASQHRMGQSARSVIERHRTRILDVVGGQTRGMAADQLVFTSGGTESNNLALIGLALMARQRKKEQSPVIADSHEPFIVLVSAIEHPSVFGAAEQLINLGFEPRRVPVDQRGVVLIDQLKSMIDEFADPTIGNRILLASIMLANNETGVIQPIQQAAEICRRNGILIHTDAVQAVAKIPVDFQTLGVDAMTMTAHKFNGPRGIGGLVLKHGVQPQPILFGGFQQMAIRPGTEDVAMVAGLRTAIDLFADNPERLKPVQNLRDRLQIDLLESLGGAADSDSESDPSVSGNSIVIVGGQSERVPHTLNVSFPGVDRQALLLAADMAGLAISTGSACASGSSELSPVLLAMGLPTPVVESSIRISLGVSTTEAEIVETHRRILRIVNDLRREK